ncbi:MAG TPA: DNA primase, partial [Solirubrobacterales bacterium]|nr:DNA primase [Solirubrobacterales bacterium]
MALISNESLERVKQAVDIVEVISAHTDLRRQGARWVGLCPFHEERTPSFSVDAGEKLYHCFGCGVGGDTIKFIEEKEGLGFAEAVELLADRYGVELEREKEDPRAEAKRQQRRRLEELLDRTAAFYASCLWESDEASKARTYLAERGLGEEVLRKFVVGYAPSAWDTVLLRGQRAGFSVEELGGVGLVQRGRGGGEYDRFRSRIMFPIRDRRGRTLGFGGRAMRSDQGAKYVNTAETEFFQKKQMLYGFDLAKAAMAKGNRAVVVEGYTDVLALHQAGIEEAVGVMGTAITEEQVKTLAVVEEVLLGLDADAAGQEAMLRAQRVAGERKMRLRVAAMPAGEDPAEMMTAEGGPERFRALLDGAVELIDFQVGLVLERTNISSPAERDRALNTELAPLLAGLGEGAAQERLVQRVAERLDMDPAMVKGRVVSAAPVSGGTRDTPANQGDPPPTPRKATGLTSRERRERTLLAMCIALPDAGRQYLDKLTPEHLSPLGERALSWLREHLEEPTVNLPQDDPELSSLIAEMVVLASSDPATPEANNEPPSPEAMELNFLLLEQRRIEAEIAAAGEAEDPQRRAALSMERAALVQ